MTNIRLTLRDAHGNLVEQLVLAPATAAERARNFVLIHGSDPDEDGRDAATGSIRFEPTDEPADLYGERVGPID